MKVLGMYLPCVKSSFNRASEFFFLWDQSCWDSFVFGNPSLREVTVWKSTIMQENTFNCINHVFLSLGLKILRFLCF